MYTGIIQSLLPVASLSKKEGLMRFSIRLPKELQKDLAQGASVGIDGVCLTVSEQKGDEVFFDAMGETLAKTTLGELKEGSRVNVERSALPGQEVGGHILSGHIDGMAEIIAVENPPGNHVVTFRPPVHLMKFIFSKGFIALDGASLTVVDAKQDEGTFKIWFIPETLARTTFGFKKARDRVNIEVEQYTKVIVETVERLLPDLLSSRT